MPICRLSSLSLLWGYLQKVSHTRHEWKCGQRSFLYSSGAPDFPGEGICTTGGSLEVFCLQNGDVFEITTRIFHYDRCAFCISNFKGPCMSIGKFGFKSSMFCILMLRENTMSSHHAPQGRTRNCSYFICRKLTIARRTLDQLNYFQWFWNYRQRTKDDFDNIVCVQAGRLHAPIKRFSAANKHLLFCPRFNTQQVSRTKELRAFCTLLREHCRYRIEVFNCASGTISCAVAYVPLNWKRRGC